MEFFWGLRLIFMNEKFFERFRLKSDFQNPSSDVILLLNLSGKNIGLVWKYLISVWDHYLHTRPCKEESVTSYLELFSRENYGFLVKTTWMEYLSFPFRSSRYKFRSGPSQGKTYFLSAQDRLIETCTFISPRTM